MAVTRECKHLISIQLQAPSRKAGRGFFCRSTPFTVAVLTFDATQMWHQHSCRCLFHQEANVSTGKTACLHQKKTHRPKPVRWCQEPVVRTAVSQRTATAATNLSRPWGTAWRQPCQTWMLRTRVPAVRSWDGL